MTVSSRLGVCTLRETGLETETCYRNFIKQGTTQIMDTTPWDWKMVYTQLEQTYQIFFSFLVLISQFHSVQPSFKISALFDVLMSSGFPVSFLLLYIHLRALCAFLRCLFVALCVLVLWPSFDVLLADQVSVVIPMLQLKKTTKVFAPI